MYNTFVEYELNFDWKLGSAAAYIAWRCCAVVGCTDKMQVVNGWVSRLSNNHLVVRCNWTRREFHMKCIGNSWIGDVVNCTQHRIHFVLSLLFEDSCRNMCSTVT